MLLGITEDENFDGGVQAVDVDGARSSCERVRVAGSGGSRGQGHKHVARVGWLEPAVVGLGWPAEMSHCYCGPCGGVMACPWLSQSRQSLDAKWPG